MITMNRRSRQFLSGESLFAHELNRECRIPDVVACACPNCGEPVVPQTLRVTRDGKSQTLQVLRCVQTVFNKGLKRSVKVTCHYSEVPLG